MCVKATRITPNNLSGDRLPDPEADHEGLQRDRGLQRREDSGRAAGFPRHERRSQGRSEARGTVIGSFAAGVCLRDIQSALLASISPAVSLV